MAEYGKKNEQQEKKNLKCLDYTIRKKKIKQLKRDCVLKLQRNTRKY